MYFFNSKHDVRPIDEAHDRDTNGEGQYNVFCEDPYEKSYAGFKTFDFTMDETPAEEAWDIELIKNDYSSAAQRNGKKYDIPTEKKLALELLDREISKHSTKDDNVEADNRLDSTINWLRKRQQDVIALENRNICHLYDIDLFAEEMEKLDDHSEKRDKVSSKLKKDTVQFDNAFGQDRPA